MKVTVAALVLAVMEVVTIFTRFILIRTNLANSRNMKQQVELASSKAIVGLP